MDALWGLLACAVTGLLTWLSARSLSARETQLLEIVVDSANEALAKQRREIDAIKNTKSPASKSQAEAIARVRDAVNRANRLPAQTASVPDEAVQGDSAATSSSLR
jgi:hypothetical protein